MPMCLLFQRRSYSSESREKTVSIIIIYLGSLYLFYGHFSDVVTFTLNVICLALWPESPLPYSFFYDYCYFHSYYCCFYYYCCSYYHNRRYLIINYITTIIMFAFISIIITIILLSSSSEFSL